MEHDESRDNFTAEKIAQNGNEITISYSNAKAGENGYISCIILDDESEIKYYGKLAKAEAENGEVKLILSEEFEIGDNVNVVAFNDQCYEGNETDWSGWPKGLITVATAQADDKSSDESDFNFSFSYLEPSESFQKKV